MVVAVELLAKELLVSLFESAGLLVVGVDGLCVLAAP